MEEETIRLYHSSIFLLTSLQMTGIHVLDIFILDGQVRFVKFEKRVDIFCITYKLPVQITKIFILIYFFRKACWESLDVFRLSFLITSLSQTPHCYIFGPFQHRLQSATFVGNATEAMCRLLRIPFRFDSHERNPKSARSSLQPPNTRSVFTQFKL
jgi:hypothetical protein